MAFCTMQIGGGGFMTAMKFASDGTAITKSDVYGNWVKAPAGTSWSQLVTSSAMPSGATTAYNDGPYDIAIAPSDSQRLYQLLAGVLYFSTNQGASWTAYTNWTTINSSSASGNNSCCANVFQDRRSGPRIAVDPNNKDVIYVTTPENGVFVSTNAGTSAATFTAITSIPAAIGVSGTSLATNSTTASGNNTLHFASGAGSVTGTIIDITNPAAIPAGTTVSSSTSTSVTMSKNAAATVGSGDTIMFGGQFLGYAVVVDPGSGCPTSCTGGISNTVYVAPYGSQVYKTTNAGSSWTATSGGPTSFSRMIVAGGVVYLVSESDGTNTSTGSIWKYNGSWSQPNVLTGVHDIAADPSNSARLIYITDGGAIALSTDSAGTWGSRVSGGRTCTDIPWMAATNEAFMSSGAIGFDPNQSNVLYFAEGIGVWTASFTGSAFNWTCKSKGIENLVTNQVFSSPNYTWPLVGVWDRQTFHFTDPTGGYAATQQPSYGLLASISMGWAYDYASGATGTICGLINWWQLSSNDFSGCSTDGGATWTQFSTNPFLQYLVTNGTTAAGNNTLHFASVPQSLLSTQYQFIDMGVLLTTTVQANPGDSAFTFASVPAALSVGSSPVTVLSGSGSIIGLSSVTGKTATTVSIDSTVATTIPAGSVLQFPPAGGQPLNTNSFVSSTTSTTVVMGANASSPGVLSGETIRFQGAPAGGIAASTANNLIIVPENNWNYIQYTKDGGATWKNAIFCSTYAGTNPQTCTVTMTGFDSNGAAIQESGQSGWGPNYFDNRHVIAADRVTANKFYAENFRTGAGGGGIYVTTDGGDTWTRASTSTCGDNGGFLAKLETVPGNAGHFFCSGNNFTFQNLGLYRSCDGGATVTQLANTSDAHGFAVGAIKPGNSYPSVYFMGQISSVKGIWRSDNMPSNCGGTETWTRVWNDYFPGGWLNDMSWLEADKTTWGKIYIGRGQTGAVFGVQN